MSVAAFCWLVFQLCFVSFFDCHSCTGWLAWGGRDYHVRGSHCKRGPVCATGLTCVLFGVLCWLWTVATFCLLVNGAWLPWMFYCGNHAMSCRCARGMSVLSAKARGLNDRTPYGSCARVVVIAVSATERGSSAADAAVTVTGVAEGVSCPCWLYCSAMHGLLTKQGCAALHNHTLGENTMR